VATAAVTDHDNGTEPQRTFDRAVRTLQVELVKLQEAELLECPPAPIVRAIAHPVRRESTLDIAPWMY
jgi:hypothetical protein